MKYIWGIFSLIVIFTYSVVAQRPTLSNGFAASSAGGTCSSLGGDVTGTCSANTVGKINGTSFAGTNGDIVNFGASNIPVDSGILATSLAPINNPTFTGVVTVPGGAAFTTGFIFTSGAILYSRATSEIDFFPQPSTTISTVSGVTSIAFGTQSNCSSSASPAICAAAPAGSAVIAASATTVVVNTTAVSASSQILITFDSSLGTKLGVTCNTTIPALYGVVARTAATSFTIQSTSPIANPACFSYMVVN